MSFARRLLTAALAALLVLTATLVTGCCEDCDCSTDPVPDPTAKLLGTWECVRYTMNGEEQTAQVGMLMALEDGGHGWLGETPDAIVGEFAWAATDSVLFMEVPDMGISSAAQYTVRDDSLFLFQEGSFMTSYDMESDYVRWVAGEE